VCQLTKLNGTTVSFQYDKRGNLRVGDGLTMTYTAMDKPLTVDGRGATTSFVYGSDNMRAKQSRIVGSTTTTTYYVDKYYETDSDGSWRAYLDDIAVLSYTSQRGHLLQFTLKDRLGSATTLADQNGNIVSQRYFDPFGRTTDLGINHKLDIQNKNTVLSQLQDLAVTNKNRRGFTDHEHLNEQQLIHMNGRVYDYNLGRFMSVDPLIQSPTSTQSVNPYSYIMNNPLAGTDPTGYCSTGTHIKGKDVAGCSVVFDAGSGGSGKKKSEAKVTSNGAPLVQQKTPANLQVSELNGQGQIAANGETAPKPTENDGWSYIGQNAEGMENYQTVYTPPSAGMITASQASFLFVMAAVDGPAPIGDGLAIVAGAGFVAYNMSHGNKSDSLKALAMMRGDAVSSPGSPMPDPDDENDRKQNISKQESKVWKNLHSHRGKTKTNGLTGKNRRYYEWDHTHNDIEVYDSKGRHMGSMDPKSGQMYKNAVQGRTIDL